MPSCASESEGVSGDPPSSATREASLSELLSRAAELEQEVRYYKGVLRHVIEAVPSVVFIRDETGRYVLGNSAKARLYGTDVETLEGQFDRDFRPLDDCEAFLAIDQKVLASNQPSGPYEVRLGLGEGNSRWFEMSKFPLPEEEIGMRLVLGVSTDITERKSYEIELLKIRHALDSAGDAITITDLNGEVLYLNPAFERLTGYDLAELNTAGGTRAIYADAEEREMILEAISTDRFFEGDVKLRHRDGSPREVSQRIDIIRSSDGTHLGIVGVRFDVGEKRRLEAQVRQSEKLAALGKLVAGVAHEVNNPLAAISINAQILKRHGDSEVVKRADTILRMVDRAGKIGNSLLSFARETGERRMLQQVDEIVASALELCAPSIRQSGATLEAEYCREPFNAFVDVGQIEQIVLNLVSNALYAMRDCELKEVRVSTRREQDWGVICVTDTGVGIAEDDRSRIFEPFYSTKEVGQGTGLGLSICHGIATAHGGTLTFDTVLGQGTTFELRLPLRNDD